MEKLAKAFAVLAIAAAGFLVGIPAGAKMCRDANAATCWNLQQEINALKGEVADANGRAARSDAYRARLDQIVVVAQEQ